MAPLYAESRIATGGVTWYLPFLYLKSLKNCIFVLTIDNSINNKTNEMLTQFYHADKVQDCSASFMVFTMLHLKNGY